MRWIVATDLGARSLIHEFVNCLHDHNQHVIPVNMQQILTPSWKPDLPVDNTPTIFYGSTNFVSRMGRLGYKPGVCGTEELFAYDNLIKHIPSEMIFNDPVSAIRGTARDIIEHSKKYSETDELFFKPALDSKLFSGAVMKMTDIRRICKNIDDGIMPDSTPDFPLLLAQPYGIEAEYRLFIVNGEIVSSSMYLPDVKYGAPEQIINFARKVIDTWNPTDIYTLDLCLSNGNPYIMEIQNFHSAGFYANDLNALIEACIKHWDVHNG